MDAKKILAIRGICYMAAKAINNTIQNKDFVKLFHEIGDHGCIDENYNVLTSRTSCQNVYIRKAGGD